VVLSILHQLVVIFNRDLLIISLLTKVVKDFITYPVAQSLMVVTIKKERVLVVNLRIRFSK
jgi:hypothetical protein